MNTRNKLISLAILASTAGWAHAQGEIYRCPDGTGRSTYTNVKRETVGKNCTMVTREVSVVPATPVARSIIPAKATGPVLSRDESRRKILENELESEQRLLTDARQKLVEQGAGSGDRLKPYQETVDLHQKNIEQLQHELGNYR
jgi:uncharacterized protein DUF4124